MLELVLTQEEHKTLTQWLGPAAQVLPGAGVAVADRAGLCGGSDETLHRRPRAVEFRTFMAAVTARSPAHLDVHLVRDNYGYPKAPTGADQAGEPLWLPMHYRPTHFSRINQVECWFAELTRQLSERADAGTPLPE